MALLLDTSAFSDLMREEPQAVAHLTTVTGSERVVICAIVRGEVLYGMQRLPAGRRRRALEARAAQLFAVIPCEPVPESAGDLYAAVKLARQQEGLALDDNDLWIAATALALSAVLVSRDSDFQHIDGLTVEDWST